MALGGHRGWRACRAAIIATLASVALLAGGRGTQDANANGETRTLELYHAHTRESLRVTFKRDGVFDDQALAKLNHFLRDWRNDDQITMAPQLFDIVWYVYREVGASEPVKVVSAYRSPGTNAMLARRSRAVAKNSHHMRGNAMDFHIPGISMAKVREIAMRLQRGGVGYYPTAGSPFVHLDVGTVRSWPRMPREQLERLFPDGKTVHLPADGVPLANYQSALAEVQARGGNALDYDTVRTSSGRTLWALLFGAGEEDESESARPARRGTNSRAVAARGATQPAGDSAAVSENVMVASVVPAESAPGSRASPRRPVISSELRPQPGTEPPAATVAAPASAAPPAAQAPLQVANLPLPPIRPRELASSGTGPAAAEVANLPIPPIRPRAFASLSENPVPPQAAPTEPIAPAAPAAAVSAPSLPVPPQRQAAPAVAAPTEIARADLPEPPQRRENPANLAAVAAPLPGLFRAEPAPAGQTAQAYARADLPQPPRRPGIIASSNEPRFSEASAPAVASAQPVRQPIRVKAAAPAGLNNDLTALTAHEMAREARPSHVVNVAPPPVSAEVKREVVAQSLVKARTDQGVAGFSGGFIRPIGSRFTHAPQP
jgi:uncharacterized protein YcbK (DUF882 family)